MATPYWLTFTGRGPGCVEAETPERAKELGAEITGKPVITCDVLPYPSSPKLNNPTGCPDFCYAPDTCKGRTCCPQRFSCTD